MGLDEQEQLKFVDLRSKKCKRSVGVKKDLRTKRQSRKRMRNDDDDDTRKGESADSNDSSKYELTDPEIHDLNNLLGA
eukprot:6907724-Karenia_brevis.AAC.1